MARVLVTGGSGFIGSHLAKALQAQGDDVTCLVRKSPSAESPRPLDVTFAYGDVLDRESLKSAVVGKSTVYHVAGCITSAERKVLYEVNEKGTRNVAAVCAEQTSPPVVVFVSSLAASGPAPEGRPRTEDDPPAPRLRVWP